MAATGPMKLRPASPLCAIQIGCSGRPAAGTGPPGSNWSSSSDEAGQGSSRQTRGNPNSRPACVSLLTCPHHSSSQQPPAAVSSSRTGEEADENGRDGWGTEGQEEEQQQQEEEEDEEEEEEEEEEENLARHHGFH